MKYILTKCLILLLISGTVYAKTPIYILVGGGKTALKLDGNGTWWQDGFPHDIKKTDYAWMAGIGMHFNNWLDTEAIYHDIGGGTIKADFVGPDSAYSATSATHCNGPCPPMQHGFGVGSYRGYSLSLLPNFKIGDFEGYARIGAIHVKMSWQEHIDTIYGSYDISTKEHQTRPLIGIGARYKSFGTECNRWEWSQASNSGFRGTTTCSITYRKEF
jgi:hypothetical protein